MAKPANGIYFSEKAQKMKDMCSKPDGSAGVPALALRAIWDVDADPSYDVHRNGQGADVWIAVRTLKGQGSMHMMNGKTLDLPAGSVAVVQGRQVKRYLCNGLRWMFWWFEFTAVGPVFFPSDTVMSIPLSSADTDEFKTVFTSLRRHTESQRALATAMFSAMLHRWMAGWERESARGPHHDAIVRVMDSMVDHLEDGWTVSEMAGAAGMSERTFRNAFTAVTGKSPKEFYDGTRLSIAEELLAKGRHTVSEVAYRLGFSSPFHFSKAYRRRFGMPPSSARIGRAVEQ